MLSTKLVDILNKQINYELYSEHVYLAMAAYCSEKDLEGFANFFMVQAEEERFHAMKIFNYIIEMDERVRISSSPQPQNDYESILDVLQAALKQEKNNTKNIYEITDVAMEERHHATISFMKWFIDEQVEEEALVNSIIKKLQRIGHDNAALFMLDNELATRTFTPPVNNAN